MDKKFLTSLALVCFVYVNIGAVDQAVTQLNNGAVEPSEHKKILSMTPEDQEARARATQVYNESIAHDNQTLLEQNDRAQPIVQGCPIPKR